MDRILGYVSGDGFLVVQLAEPIDSSLRIAQRINIAEGSSHQLMNAFHLRHLRQSNIATIVAP